MRIVLQRVSQARVEVDGQLISEINLGLLLLVGIEADDGPEDIAWLAGKITRMRIFADDNGLMNRSVLDLQGEILAISQFTLHASTRKGNRPSFIRAARPEIAQPLYEQFCQSLEAELGSSVSRGVFGADMKVSLLNDGPVTVIIDSKNRE
ncbi:D-tyrosyl-tRNA(Tyr) deacylase [Haloferula luteola]|uniref:D-aminoacyl-tRNA deacylase n=1 Tax=Haloferula luteola TaxID=595692 RepID=A0A840V9C8_9BACT|nr:D-aminoacyl-tRNA deacylase [Haloferula luteola]MBB5350560.1 D-tyrosyl-tRNA(Tyr) deacylase [Haloferula luteola]